MSVDIKMKEYNQICENIEEIQKHMDEMKEQKRSVALQIHEETKGAIFSYEKATYRTINKADGQCYVRTATEKKSA